MKKILASLAAASLLVAGGVTTAVVSGGSVATAQEAPGETPGTSTDETRTRPDKGAILDEVLDQLVTDGVIDSDQATAVKDALTSKAEELRANRPERGHHRGPGNGIGRELLEDGVISADELAELPEGHPLTDPDGPFGEYLEDGQITQDELEEARAQLEEQFGDGFRGRRGFRGFGPGPNADDAPASSTEA